MKTAVILFNLGAPDGQKAVGPFLFNLFYDRAILRLPNPVRFVLAWLLATRRTAIAQETYQHMGGGSPLLAHTQDQADALETALGPAYQTFIAMRYWHPFTAETAQRVKAYAPDRIVLLPLYPQYSTTTTASSLRAWHTAAAQAQISVPTRAVCCYPALPGFVEEIALQIKALLEDMGGLGTRVLFSAHGLPERIVRQGDPYVAQVARTVAAVLEKLPAAVDFEICYQSRATPVPWTQPATPDALTRAGRDQKDVILVPISFVSEHSETLVELDIEYKAHAQSAGVRRYVRLPAVATSPRFIAGLRDLVVGAGAQERACCGAGCWKKGVCE